MNKKELMVLILTVLAMIIMALGSYKIRGEFAVGGEIIAPIIGFVVWFICNRFEYERE